MKTKVLKAVYGVMLSAVLVVTTAIPALAVCGISHTIKDGTVTRTYINASERSHQVKEVTTGKCTDCGETVTITNTYTESHTPDANGKCTACRYQVWHRP